MSTILTQQEANVLSRLAYMNFTDQKTGQDIADRYKGKTLQDLAKDFYVDPASGDPLNKFGGYGSLTDEEQNAMLGDVISGKYENLTNLVLKDYDNQNNPTGSGFVGYAFYDGSAGGNSNAR